MSFEDNLIENLVFGRFGLNSSVFEKLYISYSCILFIKHCALRSFCIKMLFFFFQKTVFFRFLIDRTYCSTDRKCDKKLGFNLPGSISFRLVLDRSNMIFDWSNLFFWLIENRSESFLKGFSHVIHHTVHSFSKALSLLLGPIHLKSIFVVFFLIFLKGFCLQVLVRPYYPFFFILFTFFMHLRWNFRTYGFLGFLIFELISFKIDHWFLFLDVINMFPMH